MSTYFQKGLDRRRLLQVWGLAGMGVLISGCAGPGSGSQEELNPPEDGEAEGSLSFAHWRAEDNEAFDDIIADFVDTHSDVTVSQNISPSDDYQATALQRIRGGEIGDLFAAFRGKQFVDMVSAGVFTDLTDQPYVQNYIEELIDAGKDSDRQLGLPYQMVFNTPLVNRELLEENGFTDLPEDWDGFLEMCEELNGNGDRKSVV